MDEQTKTIFVLLAIIAICLVVFVLKITGVIKPEERKIIEETEQLEELYIYDYNDNYSSSFINFVVGTSIASSIISLAITIIICIGIGKLYRKLGMPDWCVYMQYIAPLLNLTNLIPVIGGVLSLIIAILQIVTLAYFFGSVGMSKLWAVCPTIALIIIIFGMFQSFAGLMITNDESTGGGVFMIFVAYALLLAFLVAYIIANVKVGKMLNKGTGFIIGLAILPVIFQPILGYMKDSNNGMLHDYIDTSADV